MLYKLTAALKIHYTLKQIIWKVTEVAIDWHTSCNYPFTDHTEDLWKQCQLHQKSRYGFYYYPDTLHYWENDIHTWIPELNALGASWLTLLAPIDRAIPELFIRRIVNEGIQPILHLPLSTTNSGF